MLAQMPMPIFGQTAVIISPQLIPEVPLYHSTPVPCKNNKVKTDYQIQTEANLGSLEVKKVFTKSKIKLYFTLTHPTCSLLGGVWFSGGRHLIDCCSTSVSANSDMLADPINHRISNLIVRNQALVFPQIKSEQLNFLSTSV